MFMYMYH